ADYSSTPNKITSPNLEETISFENNNIEFNIRNEEILEDPEIIPDPTTNENSKTILETVDTTQEQSTTITRIIQDLTEENQILFFEQTLS
ncbi:26168_t:CDS:1, partial [Gigaspora rosea]